MKKNILISSLILCVTLFTGCQGGDETVFAQGEWEMSRIESREVVIEGDELIESYGGKVIYEFAEDGKGTLLIGDQTYAGEWTVEEEVTTFIYNDIVVEFTQDGENLISNPDGILVVLERVLEVSEEEFDATEE